MSSFRWNKKKVKKLISNGGDVSFLLKKYDIKQDTILDINTLEDNDQDTALYWTLENGDALLFLQLLSIPKLELPDEIIDSIVSVDLKKYNGNDREEATDKYINDILPSVIYKGANINYRNELWDGLTPLVFCIRSDNEYSRAAIPILLNNRVGTNVKCFNGRTPLIHATRDFFNIPDTVNLLLAFPETNINAQCYGGYTSLMYAIVYSTDLCDIILNAGAKVKPVDIEGNTALHICARNNSIMGVGIPDIEFCVKLILRGASPFAKNNIGKTPLDVYAKIFDENGIENEARNIINYIDITQETIDQHKQQMLDAYEVYLQRVRDENWTVRWPLMNVLTGSSIIPMARHVAADAVIQATLDKSIKLPSISRNTPQENRSYLHGQVFKNPGILRNIVLFLGREPDEIDDKDYNYRDDYDEEKGHSWKHICKGE
jgi:ankyrin repeat protein